MPLAKQYHHISKFQHKMWPKERLSVAEGTYISENELRVWKQYKKLSIPIW
jgi:hypothetical protein